MKIFDLHCDTLLKLKNAGYSISKNDGHITDIALKSGGYLAQCFAIYTPPEIRGEDAYLHFKTQYKLFENTISDSKILKKAVDKNTIFKSSQNANVSAVLTVENAELLNYKPDRLTALENCGVKLLGLIHNRENCLAFPHSTPNMPLKNFGREVIDALNSVNIIVDVSHLNYGGFIDVKNLSKKAIVASHSACRTLCGHTRNLYDTQIIDIANSGGIIGIPFYSYFLNGTNKTKISDILYHLEHLIKTGGEDVAAIGTDFDGIDCDLFLNNCGEMPLLVDTILQKFGVRITEKICYKNALRVLG